MSERRTAGRFYVTPRDRQMLGGAYWPVIAFATVLVIAGIASCHRRRQEGGVQ